MWCPNTFVTRETTLDFTSSGQGRLEVVQLFLDEVLFGNAVGLTSWGGDAFQPLVCEACGIEGCEPGNWLVARRAGEFAVLLPNFQAMLEDGEHGVEHAPPAYTRAKGAVGFDAERYQRFQGLVPSAPDLVGLPALRGGEAKRLLQLEAVHDMLGKFPADVAVRHDISVVCSHGDVAERIHEIAELLRALEEHHPTRLRPVHHGVVPIAFYLQSLEDELRAS